LFDTADTPDLIDATNNEINFEPKYKLKVTVRINEAIPDNFSFSWKSKNASHIFPVSASSKGVLLDLSDYGLGYPTEATDKYKIIEIGEINEHSRTLIIKAQDEEIKLAFNTYLRKEWKSEESIPTEPAMVISQKNRQKFGDYAGESDTIPQYHYEITFHLYLEFEDISKEAYYYLKIAEAGDIEAQLMISKMYLFGLGVEKSEENAKYWEKRVRESLNERAIKASE